MDKAHTSGLKSLEQPVTPETYKPLLPERFRIDGCLRLDEKLWLYDVFDQQEDSTARLWLEEVYTELEQYYTRALALKRLSHKNIWPVYDHLVIYIDGKQYFAIVARAPGTEYVTLRTLFAGAINIIVVGQIIRQLALALNYCCFQRVLHTHLEPMFIWVGRDGTVRLELFSALPDRPQNFSTGWYNPFSSSPMLLSAAYSSPEQFRTKAPGNSETEVYSLGVITYEMLTGFNPFLASSDTASRLRHLYKTVPPLHEINLQLAPSLETAIMRALTKNPDGRYATVLDFLADFEIGLANTLQTISLPVVDFTIDQLIENHNLLEKQVHSFFSQTIHKPDVTGELLSPKNLPVSEAKPNRVIELDAHEVVKPLSPVRAEPDSIKAAVTVRQGASTTKKPLNTSKANQRIIAQPALLRRNTLLPWLLVLNLFFMGYLAWLLLNSPDTINSEFPYTTKPPTRFIIPTANRIPPTLPVKSQEGLPLSVKPTLIETPAANDLNSVPTASPNSTNPHVLTALAPTVTQQAGTSATEVTVSLTPEDLITPGESQLLTSKPFTPGVSTTPPATLGLTNEVPDY